jgi:hypothetical protein
MFLNNKDQDEMFFSESDIIHLMNNYDLDECVQKLQEMSQDMEIARF